MDRPRRPSGIPLLGEIPWGSHICQFYRTPGDLLDLLVPWFRAGLENNEFCMWVTSGPLSCAAAETALREAVRDFDARLGSGQILILPAEEWYLPNGVFDAGRVLAGWIGKLDAALANGYAGLRLSGNTFWLEHAGWSDFTAYEAQVDTVISRSRVLALCTYPLARCGAEEILDVVKNHTFALIRREGSWEVIESQARRRAVAAARESQLNYESLFSNMLDGFAYHRILCNESGEPVDYLFLEVNDAFEHLTGLTREQVIGRRFTEVVPASKSDAAAWIRCAGQVALTGEPIRFEQFSAPFGKSFLVSAYSPRRGHFAVTFQDISDRKQNEAAIHNLNTAMERQVRELEIANRELESFAYSVSHDLLAPLRSINGFCHILQEDHGQALDQESREILAHVQQSTRHMASLIDALLELSRLTRAELKRAVVDASAMAREIADTLQRRHPGRRITFDLQQGLSAEADPVMFRIALENLLGNAWKFTSHRAEAQIAFSCERIDGQTVFCVRDNGVGFEMADAAKLFSPFHRLHTPDEFPGLGIGLATVLRIVQRHGGQLWAASAPGRGAAFHFRLGESPSRGGQEPIEPARSLLTKYH